MLPHRRSNDNSFLFQPVAPDDIMSVVRCNCKETKKGCCTTKRCSCRSTGLKCVSSCGNCKGYNCDNSTKFDNDDDDGGGDEHDDDKLSDYHFN